MIKFSKLFETVYEPRSGDEKNFKDKHVIAKHKYPLETESQFTSNKTKAKRERDYDKGEDEAVYEAANVHTKRADKKPVIVRDVDPKTGQSRAKVELRRAGEIKIGEEVELEEGITDMSHGRLKWHMNTGVPHGSYSKAELKAERDRRLKTGEGEAYKNAKAGINEGLDEKVKNPYAIGMAAAMKQTGDRPPLKKSTIIKGHEIAKGIKNEAMDPVGKEDSDIDNNGKVNKSDKYLHARRRAIAKAIKEENENTASVDNGSFDSYKKSNKANPVKKNPEDVVKESTQLDELSPNTLHKYIKKATPDVAARAISAVVPNQSAQTKKHASKLGKRIAGITSASGRLADKANSAMYEEVEQIDELKKSTLSSYIKKSSQRVADKANHAGEIEGRGDSNITPAARSTLAKLNRKTINGLAGISRATNRLAKEEVELEENFKAGPLKLRDGSTVKLDSKDAMTLNSLFLSLNGKNQEKMDAKMMASSKGFSEILAFAKEAI